MPDIQKKGCLTPKCITSGYGICAFVKCHKVSPFVLSTRNLSHEELIHCQLHWHSYGRYHMARWKGTNIVSQTTGIRRREDRCLYTETSGISPKFEVESWITQAGLQYQMVYLILPSFCLNDTNPIIGIIPSPRCLHAFELECIFTQGEKQWFLIISYRYFTTSYFSSWKEKINDFVRLLLRKYGMFLGFSSTVIATAQFATCVTTKVVSSLCGIWTTDL